MCVLVSMIPDCVKNVIRQSLRSTLKSLSFAPNENDLIISFAAANEKSLFRTEEEISRFPPNDGLSFRRSSAPAERGEISSWRTKRFHVRRSGLRNDRHCHFYLREGLGLQVGFGMTDPVSIFIVSEVSALQGCFAMTLAKTSKQSAV